MSSTEQSLLWRIRLNNFNSAPVRYRAIYPAYFLRLHHGVSSSFAAGELGASTARRLVDTNPGAIILGRDLGRTEELLLKAAREAGVRTVYDACDDIFSMDTRDTRRTVEILRSNIHAIDRLVFTTAVLKSAFVGNGIPEEKCAVIPDVMLDTETEIAATALMGTGVRKYYRRPFFRTRGGWRTPLPGFAGIPPKSAGTKRLVWFGLIASPHGQAGRELLPQVIPALNRLATEHNVDMLIVSKDEEVCAQTMQDADFPWHFVPWSLTAQLQALACSDLCVLPVGEDRFCRAKSANRALLALASGLPVITNPHPAYDGMEEALHLARSAEDWLGCLRSGLCGLSKRTEDETLEREFGGRAAAARWASVLGIAASLPDSPVQQFARSDCR